MNVLKTLILIFIAWSFCQHRSHADSSSAKFNLTLTDLNGRNFDLTKYNGVRGIVLIFRDTDCPISNKQSPQLMNLEKKYQKEKILFFIVHVDISKRNLSDSMRKIKEDKFTGPYIIDHGNRLAKTWGANTSTEILLLDNKLELKYQGAFSDQFTLAFSRPEASQQYLKDALDSLLAQKPIVTKKTQAEGCFISKLDGADSDRPVQTIAPEQVQNIFVRRCINCHYAKSGLNSLVSFRDIKDKCETIRYVVEKKLMPPWHAGTDTGPWRNNLSLTDEDTNLLVPWLKSGCPTPDAITNTEFTIPPVKMDVFYKIPKPISVPTTGQIPYQKFLVQTNLKKDRWIKRLIILPTDASVVHHVRIHILKNTKDWKLKLNEISLHSFTWVPGFLPLSYPANAGVKLPAGASIGFEIHYTPNGRATIDRTRIGFDFHTSPPEHEIKNLHVRNYNFKIPAGAANHMVTASLKATQPMTIYGLGPHMHLRGRTAKIEILSDDGTLKKIFETLNFNFKSQLNYQFVDPVKVEIGQKIICTGWFDNSIANPTNPNPEVEVTSGLEVTDEMLICGLHWY